MDFTALKLALINRKVCEHFMAIFRKIKGFLVGEFSLSEIVSFKDFESIILPDKTLPNSLYEIFDGRVALFTKCGELIIDFDGESRLCIIGVTKPTEK